MSKPLYLKNRAIIKISGKDRESFLQGLVSNDMCRVTDGISTYTWLMTPQGKYLYDFFVVPIKGEDYWLIDCDDFMVEGLLKRLSLFKLRADILLEDASDKYAVLAQRPSDNGVKDMDIIADYDDPRIKDAGRRYVVKLDDVANMESGDEEYDIFRLRLGLPSAPDDLIAEKSLALESNLELLNGLDWEKGCYMGQEVTARTKYRGLVKKKLLPFSAEKGSPNKGDIIKADNKIIGEIRSSVVNDNEIIGIALIRLDRFKKAENAPLYANKAHIKILAFVD